ncbi:uncharacterized protein LOC143775121 [Ranitomeya variabilis]|uniref:uncharacterized protein LOC143775121 n=1 Tax=Ranitomeya variabilis TaxID=490064 RepID=UPI0040575130
MLAYVLLLSALSSLEGAPASPCSVTEGMTLAGHIKELNMSCPCNETSGLDIDHKKNECNCFRIPAMSQNCNLSCFRDGINVYNEGNKEEIAKLNLPKIQIFLKRTFERRVTACNNTPCFRHPCDEMKKVNASKFWETLQEAFQNINSQK